MFHPSQNRIAPETLKKGDIVKLSCVQDGIVVSNRTVRIYDVRSHGVTVDFSRRFNVKKTSCPGWRLPNGNEGLFIEYRNRSARWRKCETEKELRP
jgi:hypothetical protein